MKYNLLNLSYNLPMFPIIIIPANCLPYRCLIINNIELWPNNQPLSYQHQETHNYLASFQWRNLPKISPRVSDNYHQQKLFKKEVSGKILREIEWKNYEDSKLEILQPQILKTLVSNYLQSFQNTMQHCALTRNSPLLT